jgi:hypothetical protein
MRLPAALAALIASASLVGGAWAAGSASGKLCGASGCLSLPRALALQFSARHGAFSSAATPKPSPYYKIVIKATGEGHIGRTILWVPSKKLWFDAEDVSPPLAGYWRTAQVPTPALTALAAKVKIFPAPKRWVLPHY